MAKLTVISDDGKQEIDLSDRSSVRETLDAAGIGIRSGCRGNGACGLCLVQIEVGDANEPTANERAALSTEQLGKNIRLACQLRSENDLSIRIINNVAKSAWRALRAGQLSCTPSQLNIEEPPRQVSYGLAVDLGTTHISLSLWDFTSGKRLASRTGPNPQSHYGADVVTRLIAAGESAENAAKISRMPFDAIGEALSSMCSPIGFSPQAVTRVVIVGNTPMLALITETDSRLLLQPDHWTKPFSCKLENTQACAQAMAIDPEASVEVISPYAGFVGSDLLAGVVATRLTERPGGLLIDFGTNSEIALWDGSTLWVTSAAGGPAFESSEIRCGMPAETGAIFRIDRTGENDEMHYQVIGGGEAKGICGSGLVDLLATLRRTGELTRTGKFAAASASDGYFVRRESPAISLGIRDVDMVQRAKAAIGVGIKTLLRMAEMRVTELNRICVSGAFGQDLNIRNAQTIGLLPEAPLERFELCGNTALAGCEQLLLSSAMTSELESLRKRAVIINMAQLDDFEMSFLDNLYLQPVKMDKS